MLWGLGGPAYIKLPDGTWRVTGIDSRGTQLECGYPEIHAMMHINAAWVEEKSGVDITPCHDADGTWNPSSDCTFAPTDAETAYGGWADGCAGGPTALMDYCGELPDLEEVEGTSGSGEESDGGEAETGMEGGDEEGESGGDEESVIGTSEGVVDEEGELEGETGVGEMESGGEEGGCSCSAQRSQGPASLLWFGGLPLLGLRLRSRGSRS